MKKGIFTLIHLFFICTVFSQPMSRENKPQEYDLAAKFYQLANISFYNGNVKDALDYGLKARAIWKKIPGSENDVARVGMLLGSVYEALDSLDRSIKMAEEGIQYVDAAQITDMSFAFRVSKVERLIKKGDYDAAQRTLDNLSLLIPSFKIADSTIIGRVYKNLGIIEMETGSSDSALIHFKKSESVFLRHPTGQEYLSDLYFLMGEIYESKESLEEAKESYWQALTYLPFDRKNYRFIEVASLFTDTSAYRIKDTLQFLPFDSSLALTVFAAAETAGGSYVSGRGILSLARNHLFTRDKFGRIISHRIQLIDARIEAGAKNRLIFFGLGIMSLILGALAFISIILYRKSLRKLFQHEQSARLKTYTFSENEPTAVSVEVPATKIAAMEKALKRLDPSHGLRFREALLTTELGTVFHIDVPPNSIPILLKFLEIFDGKVLDTTKTETGSGGGMDCDFVLKPTRHREIHFQEERKHFRLQPKSFAFYLLFLSSPQGVSLAELGDDEKHVEFMHVVLIKFAGRKGTEREKRDLKATLKEPGRVRDMIAKINRIIKKQAPSEMIDCCMICGKINGPRKIKLAANHPERIDWSDLDGFPTTF